MKLSQIKKIITKIESSIHRDSRVNNTEKMNDIIVSLLRVREKEQLGGAKKKGHQFSVV